MISINSQSMIASIKVLNRTILLLIAIVISNIGLSAAPSANVEVTVKNSSTGKSFTTTTDQNGKFTFKDLPEGDYDVTFKKKGKGGEVLSWSWGVSNASSRQAGSGMSSGKLSIVSPRDASSGLPTGKRQHKPISISMDWGSSTPIKSTQNKSTSPKSEATIMIDGTTMTGTLTDK